METLDCKKRKIMSQRKFSIITINYNNKEGLRKTIESVVGQSFRDFEYIIIDGGSTDGSIEVIKEYAGKVDYWVSEPDKGIYHAMNKGVLQAHGEYLNFMNSGDEFYNNGVLQEVAPSLDSDIVVGKIVHGTEVWGFHKEDITLMDLIRGTVLHQASFFRKELFDENRLSKSPAAFDQKKLDWMSNDYIKNADFDKVFALCKPFLEEAGRLTDKAEKLVELYKPQMTAAEEIVPLTDLFFEDFPELTEAEKEVMAGETVPTVLKAFKAKLEAMSDDEFVVENIFPQIKAVQKETGIKGKNLFMPIRIAVSGEMHGPELPDTIFLLGREKSIKHIDQVLATL